MLTCRAAVAQGGLCLPFVVRSIPGELVGTAQGSQTRWIALGVPHPAKACRGFRLSVSRNRIQGFRTKPTCLGVSSRRGNVPGAAGSILPQAQEGRYPWAWHPSDRAAHDSARHGRSSPRREKRNLVGENLHGKTKFRPDVARIVRRRVPEFAASTLLDSDRQNPRSRPGRTKVVALGRRDIVCGVSDYGALRGHFGEAAKGNPDSVPICVTMFFNQSRVVIRGIWAWTRKS
jgi:hypothetical protein